MRGNGRRMLKHTLLAALVFSSVATAAAAQGTVFIVRHAERADGGAGGMAPAGTPSSADPGLSRAGQARAESLAGMLKEAKLTAIYTTEFKRTQETAAPTAKAQGLTVSVNPAGNTPALVQKLAASQGAVLVVGHSNSVSEIIAGLGVTTPVKVEESEFDNLFIVLTGPQPRLIRLRYR